MPRNKEVPFSVGRCSRCTCGGWGMLGEGGKCGLEHERKKYEGKKELFVFGSGSRDGKKAVIELMNQVLRVETRIRGEDKVVLVGDEFRVRFFNIDALESRGSMWGDEGVYEDEETAISRKERFLRKVESGLYMRDVKNGIDPDPIYFVGEMAFDPELLEVIGKRVIEPFGQNIVGLREEESSWQ